MTYDQTLTLHPRSPAEIPRYGSFELRRVAAELKKELARLDDVSEALLTGGVRALTSGGVEPAGIRSRPEASFS